MGENLHRLAVGFLAAFGLVALTLGYWGIIRSADLLAREDNPRLVLAEQQIQRGQILARDGTVLATGSVIERHYPEPEAAPVVGYYSLRYGSDGIEGAYDEVLRGDTFLNVADREWNRLLHRDQVGGDVRLTLDVAIQAAAMEALEGRVGAIMVVDVSEGNVLALASAPSYDPNQIDEDWDALVEDPSSPLLNRATQGVYQPGTTLQVVWLGAAYNARPDAVDAPWDGDPTALIDGVVLPCAGDPRGITGVVDGFVWGCPGSFVPLVEALGEERVSATLRDFDLLGALPFDLPTQYTEEPLGFGTADLPEIALGQGELLVTPLRMARVATAMANAGVMPPLRLVDAVQAPGGSWEDVVAEGHPHAAISRDSAEAVAAAMAESVSLGASQMAAISLGEQVYGHTGLAIVGPDGTLNAWFIGFVDHTVAVAVLLENQMAADVAAEIGGQVLSVALEQVRLPPTD